MKLQKYNKANAQDMNSVVPDTVQIVVRKYLENTLDPELAKEVGEYLFQSKRLYEALKALEQLGVIILREISFVKSVNGDQVFFQIQTVTTDTMLFSIGFKPIETVVQNGIRYVSRIHNLVIMMGRDISKEITVHHEIDVEMLRDIIHNINRELRS